MNTDPADLPPSGPIPPGEVLAVIPARHASTRFPGKPLALLAGRPLILHVADNVRRARRVGTILVATDHPEIARRITVPEYRRAVNSAKEAGLTNLDVQGHRWLRG